MAWLTPGQYRRWRDCGLRGYQADGLPDGGFRGRWASRNALFADVMVRTGLRLAEQASLTVLEVPHGPAGRGYERFWLPGAVAKNESAPWVYLPAALTRKTGEYIAADRAAAVAAARARGAYDAMGGTLVIEDPGLGSRAVARRPGEGGAGGAAGAADPGGTGPAAGSARRAGWRRRCCGWVSTGCR